MAKSDILRCGREEAPHHSCMLLQWRQPTTQRLRRVFGCNIPQNVPTIKLPSSNPPWTFPLLQIRRCNYPRWWFDGCSGETIAIFFINAPSLEYLTTLSSWTWDGRSGEESTRQCAIAWRWVLFLCSFIYSQILYLTIYHFVIIIHTSAARADLLPCQRQQPKKSKTPEDNGEIRQRGWCNEVSFICITSIILILLLSIHIRIFLLFCSTVEGEGSDDGDEGGIDRDQGGGGEEGE